MSLCSLTLRLDVRPGAQTVRRPRGTSGTLTARRGLRVGRGRQSTSTWLPAKVRAVRERRSRPLTTSLAQTSPEEETSSVFGPRVCPVRHLLDGTDVARERQVADGPGVPPSRIRVAQVQTTL